MTLLLTPHPNPQSLSYLTTHRPTQSIASSLQFDEKLGLHENNQTSDLIFDTKYICTHIINGGL